ncbi:MAG: efflux RND transporter periplasmic adaptor subunit [Planctomycetes bacterium]|nr:efflux RND transporter periplasmic adaptor subunit [Planctomycetota bacterium]
MVRALNQLAFSVGVLAASFAGVSWIIGLRPVDPPLQRAEGLRFAVRALRLEAAPSVVLKRRLPGSTEPWIALALRAEVAGAVELVRPDLEPGARVGAPAEKGASAREELLRIDLATYRLQRELAEERAAHARAQVASQEAEIARSAELVELGETNLALAQNALDRLQGRLGGGASGAVAISDQQVEDAVRQVGQARSNLANQRAGLVVARQNALAQASLIAVAEGELALARLREQKASVRAPWEAYVQRRSVSDGAAVMIGQELLELRALAQLRVAVHVPVELYARCGPATRAAVRFPQLAAVSSAPFEARLGTAAPEVDAATRSVRVEFWMENPAGTLPSPQLDGRLPAGLACDVELDLGAIEGALWIPEEALRFGGASPSVVRIVGAEGADPRAEILSVALGTFQDGRYVLRADPEPEDPSAADRGERSPRPLAAGDRIALGDLEALRGGEALRVLASDEASR